MSVIEIPGHKIYFGVAMGLERDMVMRERLRVYKQYGYYYDENVVTDQDSYDEYSPYFVARLEDGRIIGSTRLVPGKDGTPFPIESSFKFTLPDELKAISITERAEIGKLVSEKPKNIEGGRLIVTLGLIDAVLCYSEKNKLILGFSFIRDRLLHALQEFEFPFHELKDAELIYPRDGLLAGYFYKQKRDGVTPVYYRIEEIGPAIRGIVETLNKLHKSAS
ncbi:MAG: hypothetical protein Q7S66_05905 [bacterium]|nr:hypothetical protein [bacterium]